MNYKANVTLLQYTLCVSQVTVVPGGLGSCPRQGKLVTFVAVSRNTTVETRVYMYIAGERREHENAQLKDIKSRH